MRGDKGETEQTRSLEFQAKMEIQKIAIEERRIYEEFYVYLTLVHCKQHQMYLEQKQPYSGVCQLLNGKDALGKNNAGDTEILNTYFSSGTG